MAAQLSLLVPAAVGLVLVTAHSRKKPGCKPRNGKACPLDVAVSEYTRAFPKKRKK